MIRHAPSIGIGIGLSLRSQGFGVSYVKAGRVLDYSTQVGPFTIVDKSGQDNTATLYSGRGLTMDGVSDLIDFGSPTFSEPVTSVTGYARSTDTSINLGLASATLSGNDTWETFSADTPAKDYGDAQWFNGTDTYVIKNISGFRSSDSSGSIEATFITTATTISTLFASCDTAGGSNRFQFQLDSSGRVQVVARVSSFNAVRTLASFNDGQQHTAKLTSNGTSWQIEVDGSVEAIEVFSGSNSGRWFSDVPNRDNITVGVSKYNAFAAFATASISEVIVSDGTSTPVLRYTGLGNDPWKDTIGSNDGTLSGVDQTVTEYFTNPDFILGTGYNGDLSDIRCLGATGTVLGHWTLADWSNPAGNTSNGKTIVDSGPNGYHGTCTGCSGFTGEGIDPEVAGIVGLDDAQWFNGVDTSITAATPVFPATADFDETFEIYVGNLTAPAPYLYYISQVSSSGNNFGLAIAPTTGVITVLIAGIAIQSATSHYGEHITVRLTRVGTTFEMLINGVSEGTYVSANSIDQVATVFGKNATVAGRNVTGLIYGDSVTGTPSGTFVTVGQKRATIPQTADKNWNKYQWFNGVDTAVDCGSIDITSYTEIDIEVSFFTKLAAGAAKILFSIRHSGSDDIRIAINSAGDLIAVLDDGTADFINFGSGYNDGNVHTLIMSFNGSVLSGTVDDANPQSNSSASFNFATASGETAIGERFGGSLLFGEGAIYDVKVSNQSGLTHAWTGLGNDPWKDTIGSNNGTESGTFTRELVSASDANDQIDALGNAILEPRRNTQQLNLFGEGEYSSTPDSDSLDLTTEATWEIWGNFYGPSVNNFDGIFAKYFAATGGRSWTITKKSGTAADVVRMYFGDSSGATASFIEFQVPDKVVHLLITFSSGTVKVYVDTVDTTVTGTAPSAIYVSEYPVTLGAYNNGNPLDRKIGSAKIYNRALTADEVLTNYDTQKSLYGL